MSMPFEWFIGSRFLKPRRRQVLLSVITFISILGVMVAVTALIVVISALSGFQEQIQTKSLEAFSHLLVLSYQPNISDYEQLMERVNAYDHVIASSPFFYGEVMLASEAGVSGCILRGVRSDLVGQVTSLEENMVIGKIDTIDKEHPSPYTDEDIPDEERPAYPGILLGEELAGMLHVVVGSEVRVVSPLGENTPMGPVPKMRKFVVSGVFSSGMYEFDAKFAFISLKQAQSFFGRPGAITGLEVKMDDIWAAREIGTQMEDDLGFPYRTKDWMAMNRNLFSAMKLEKLVMFIIVSLIMFVAGLNIFSTLYMFVMDKKKSIAILKTMGASNRNIMNIFVSQGLYIGFFGSFLGFVVGVGLCLMQMKYGLVRLDPQVYFIETLPMTFKLWDFTLIAVAVFIFSFVATVIPARIAAQADPAKVIRYE